MNNPFAGDPRIILTPNGATFQVEGGQPLMDAGVENATLLALFTDSDWVGNLVLPTDRRIGSKFEATVRNQPITLSGLRRTQDAASRALESPLFPDRKAVVTNPESTVTALQVSVGPGAAPLSLTKFGPNWQSQAQNPASGRIK